jgi:aspartate kinase
MSDPPEKESPAVRSATLKKGVARVVIHGLPDAPGIAAKLFGDIGGRNINIEDIIHTASDSGRNVIVSFTVDGRRADEAQKVAEECARQFGAVTVEVARGLARLRVVGMGMRAHSGVAAKLFEAIAHEKVNIESISTSEIVISVLIPEAESERALRAVHDAFELEQEEPE